MTIERAPQRGLLRVAVEGMINDNEELPIT